MAEAEDTSEAVVIDREFAAASCCAASGRVFATMNLELDADEESALVAELRRIIRDAQYPLSRRIRTLRGILDKMVPPPVREPLPAPKVYAPPRATVTRRRRR